jgi:ABC-type transporter Mla MlaB component
VSDASPGAGADPVVTVALTGPVTLGEAPRWREALIAAMAEAKPVRIDLESSGPWDLAGLQLLISAVATGRRSGQAVRLAHAPRGLLAIADQAGVADRLSEAIDGGPD